MANGRGRLRSLEGSASLTCSHSRDMFLTIIDLQTARPTNNAPRGGQQRDEMSAPINPELRKQVIAIYKRAQPPFPFPALVSNFQAPTPHAPGYTDLQTLREKKHTDLTSPLQRRTPLPRPRLPLGLPILPPPPAQGLHGQRRPARRGKDQGRHQEGGFRAKGYVARIKGVGCASSAKGNETRGASSSKADVVIHAEIEAL